MNIWFDMDGTIADLYGEKDWLADIEAENARPFKNARPLVNCNRLAKALHKAQRNGAKIGVLTWTPKGTSAAYNEKVAGVKKAWLAKHLKSVCWDEIKVIPYGVPKQEQANGILFDDEERNRTNWGEGAYEPNKIWEVLAVV